MIRLAARSEIAMPHVSSSRCLVPWALLAGFANASGDVIYGGL